jgi:DNA-binding MarR family transcriptional regulator
MYDSEMNQMEPARATPATVSEAEQPYRPVGFVISTTGHAISRRFRESLKSVGLAPQELGLLQAVASAEGLTQQAIADAQGIARSRMVVLVDALEQRRLVKRRRNPEDRRAHALYLTPKGHKLLARAFPIAVEHEQQLTDSLSVEEREQLLELLDRVGMQVGIPPGVHPGMGHSALADETDSDQEQREP